MRAVIQESARELFLLNLGVRRTEDIVRWADAIIAKEETPGEALIDLSTTPPERIDRFISILSVLRSGSDFWSAARDSMPAIHDYVAAHKDEAERIATSLFLLAAGDLKKMPDDFSFIFHFDDAFELARSNVYGTPESVYQDFVAALKRFKAGPNQPPQRNAGSRPSSSDSPVSETPSSLGPRG